jgi:hypothetical protein
LVQQNFDAWKWCGSDSIALKKIFEIFMRLLQRNTAHKCTSADKRDTGPVSSYINSLGDRPTSSGILLYNWAKQSAAYETKGHTNIL